MRDFESGRRIDFKTQDRNGQTVANPLSWNGRADAGTKQGNYHKMVKRKQASSKRSDRKLTPYNNWGQN